MIINLNIFENKIYSRNILTNKYNIYEIHLIKIF